CALDSAAVSVSQVTRPAARCWRAQSAISIVFPAPTGPAIRVRGRSIAASRAAVSRPRSTVCSGTSVRRSGVSHGRARAARTGLRDAFARAPTSEGTATNPLAHVGSQLPSSETDDSRTGSGCIGGTHADSRLLRGQKPQLARAAHSVAAPVRVELAVDVAQ